MKDIQFNNGQRMPLVGTGTNTYGKEKNDYHGKLNGDFSDLKSAIDLGYRSIDAAVSYQNERGVGKTLAQSNVAREDFFITSKIPRKEIYYATKEAVRKTIDSSLANFETDYLDLYLIHHPIEDKEQLRHTWAVLEEYYQEGKLKSIGVSNFNQSLVEELYKFAIVPPAVNQIQINLKEKNEALIQFVKDLGITPVAWGPMKTTADQRAVLTTIGTNYGKSWGQVLLRYQIQREIVVIPKSHNPEHQLANISIFDFQLNDNEMNQIAML